MYPSTIPLYIFDLDGTMALIEHRRHLVEKKDRKEFKPDWKAFYAACVHDAPNWPVIGTFLQLYSCGADCRIWSGRSDEVKNQTIDWLQVYLQLQPRAIFDILKMRPDVDFSPDEQLKKKWLNALPPTDRNRLCAVFDDRDKVVAMWRKEGVACFQVAPGEF